MPDAHRAFDEMIDNKGFRRLQGQFARILQLSIHYRSTISQYPFAGAFAGGENRIFDANCAFRLIALRQIHILVVFDLDEA
jgi:hypothetical protein